MPARNNRRPSKNLSPIFRKRLAARSASSWSAGSSISRTSPACQLSSRAATSAGVRSLTLARASSTHRRCSSMRPSSAQITWLRPTRSSPSATLPSGPKAHSNALAQIVNVGAVLIDPLPRWCRLPGCVCRGEATHEVLGMSPGEVRVLTKLLTCVVPCSIRAVDIVFRRFRDQRAPMTFPQATATGQVCVLEESRYSLVTAMIDATDAPPEKIETRESRSFSASVSRS